MISALALHNIAEPWLFSGSVSTEKNVPSRLGWGQQRWLARSPPNARLPKSDEKAVGVACCTSVTAVEIGSAMSRLNIVIAWNYVTRRASSWLIFMCPPWALCLQLAPYPTGCINTITQRSLFLYFLYIIDFLPLQDLAGQVFPSHNSAIPTGCCGWILIIHLNKLRR